MKNYSNNIHWSITLTMSMLLAIGTWNPTEHNFLNYLINSKNILSGFQPFIILVILVLWILAIKSIFQTLNFKIIWRNNNNGYYYSFCYRLISIKINKFY